MRGDLLNVWGRIWTEVFAKLGRLPNAPPELYSELYDELIAAPKAPDEPPQPTKFDEDGAMVDPAEIAAASAYSAAFEAYTNARLRDETARAGDGETRKRLRDKLLLDVSSESKAIEALERAFTRIEEIAGDELSNRFYGLVEAFIGKYSLRYDLRRPFSLHPTLPGIFARLVSDLKQAALADNHLDTLLREFEEALRDLTTDPSENRIKICIAKQTNFLEAIGAQAPNVNGNTLGAICNQVGTWPHDDVKAAVKSLYGFACDYPGIRHGGTAANRIRAVDMRDLVAVCVALVGFSPYLTDLLNMNQVYLIGDTA